MAIKKVMMLKLIGPGFDILDDVNRSPYQASQLPGKLLRRVLRQGLQWDSRPRHV